MFIDIFSQRSITAVGALVPIPHTPKNPRVTYTIFGRILVFLPPAGTHHTPLKTPEILLLL
jgi:hypothetical protein